MSTPQNAPYKQRQRQGPLWRFVYIGGDVPQARKPYTVAENRGGYEARRLRPKVRGKAAVKAAKRARRAVCVRTAAGR